MCLQVYMRPPFPRGDHGRRLNDLMVEGFPLFATM